MRGIIAYLTDSRGGNVHDRGVVNITSSHPNQGARNAPIGPEMARQEQCRMEGENQWICYDFKNMRVTITHYTIGGVNMGNLKNWTVEGSRDGATWVELDRRMDEPHLQPASNHPLQVTFQVERVEQMRMVRIHQVGPNHAGKTTFWIDGLEFFGTIKES
jgi:hypothetical protein